MRLKVILTPFAFLIAVIIAIFYIWPDAQGIINKRGELKKNKEELNLIMDKKNNVEVLNGILSKEKDKETFVDNYLPFSRNDEKIIDGLNYIATDSGLSIIGLSAEEEKKIVAQVQDSSAAAAASANPTLTSPKPDTKFVTVTAKVSGKYENIKMFLDQTYKMGMFNKINSLVISKVKAEALPAGQESAPSDILLANIEFKFGYMSLFHEENGSSSKVFANNDFDFAPYSKLMGSITKAIPALDEGQKRNSNPFLP